MTADARFIVKDGRRRGGWFWLDNALVDEHAARLGPHALAVYVALARLADGDARCWPSTRTLLKLTGIGSLGTLYKALHALADEGLIAIQPRVDDAGDRASNVYTLLDLHGADGEGEGDAPRDTAKEKEGASTVTGVTPAVTGVTASVTPITPAVTGCYTSCNTGVTPSVKEQYLFEQDTSNKIARADARAAPVEGSLCVPELPTTEPSPTTDIPPQEKSPRRARERRAEPSAPKPPALAAFREVFRRWPNRVQEEEIVAAVDDLDRWRAVLKAWALRGYNPVNVAGMLDWYRNGIPANGNGRPRLNRVSSENEMGGKDGTAAGNDRDGHGERHSDHAADAGAVANDAVDADFIRSARAALERQKQIARERAERERAERAERERQAERERIERERAERAERLERLRAERALIEARNAERAQSR